MSNRIRKLVLVVLTGVLIVGSLAGCSGTTNDNGTANEGTAKESETTNEGETTSEGGSGEIKVGVVLKSLANPFYVTMQEAIEAKGKELGTEIMLQAPEKETDAEKQMQIIENMLVQGVDAIILTPNGSTELVPAIKKANDKNIPVIVVDTQIDETALEDAGAHVESFVGSDNYYGGQVAAQEMYDALGGTGKVAVLEGISGHESSVARISGFSDKIKELGGLEIVASQPADWDQEKGYTVFQNILQANPEITGLFAANDMMALGAVKAIKDAGKSETITVIGFDATDDAKAAISNGEMLGSIAQSPDEMGVKALETALTYLEKGSCETDIAVEVYMLSADDM